MKINLDRLCKLAGVETHAEMLNEAGNRSYHEDPALDSEREVQFANQLNEKKDDDDPDEMYSPMMDEEEGHDDEAGKDEVYAPMEEIYEEEEDGKHETSYARMEEGVDDDELIEVDEAMLVQEIRRARKLMAEAAERKAQTPEMIQEQQLRQMISEELDSVLKDLNLTSGWIYGSDKPANSRRGVVNQAFPGIGFKK